MAEGRSLLIDHRRSLVRVKHGGSMEEEEDDEEEELCSSALYCAKHFLACLMRTCSLIKEEEDGEYVSMHKGGQSGDPIHDDYEEFLADIEVGTPLLFLFLFSFISFFLLKIWQTNGG